CPLAWMPDASIVAGTPPTTSPDTTAVPLPVGFTPSLTVAAVALKVSMSTCPPPMLMACTLTSTVVVALSGACVDTVWDEAAATLRMSGSTRAPTSERASDLVGDPNASMRMPGIDESCDAPVYSWASARIGQLGTATGSGAACLSSEPRPATTSPGHRIDERAKAWPPAARLAEVNATVPSNGACTMVKAGRVGKAENTSPLPAVW